MNIPSELEKDVSITLQRTFLQRTGLNYNNYRVGNMLTTSYHSAIFMKQDSQYDATYWV